MRRSQLEKHREQIISDIKSAEDTARISGLNTEYPNTRELKEIRKAYFDHPDIEARKKLISLRMALSKSFIANAQLNLNEARKELNKAKYRGSKNYLYGAIAALVMFDSINENYGVAGIVTALFILYMLIKYLEPSTQVERDEALTEARSYFDECRDLLMETKKETEYFADSEQYDGTSSKFYKFFEGEVTLDLER